MSTPKKVEIIWTQEDGIGIGYADDSAPDGYTEICCVREQDPSSIVTMTERAQLICEALNKYLDPGSDPEPGARTDNPTDANAMPSDLGPSDLKTG